MDMRLGVLLWSQATSWSDFESAARRVDSLGYDHLWAWDHPYAIFGGPYQPIFEGYTTLAAWAKVTTRVRLGLLVGANTFRNPGLVAKTLTTLDHISDGRAIAGLGGAWFDLEHAALDHQSRSGCRSGSGQPWMRVSGKPVGGFPPVALSDTPIPPSCRRGPKPRHRGSSRQPGRRQPSSS
jgi:Luciferase-like monooxygenase